MHHGAFKVKVSSLVDFIKFVNHFSMNPVHQIKFSPLASASHGNMLIFAYPL